MTTPEALPLTAEELARARSRHNDLCIMYGGEPWDESCVEDGEQAHMDRERLLATIAAEKAKLAVCVEFCDRIRCAEAGREWEPIFHQTIEWMKEANRICEDLPQSAANMVEAK